MNMMVPMSGKKNEYHSRVSPIVLIGGLPRAIQRQMI